MNQILKVPPVIYTGANSRNPVQLNTAGNLRALVFNLTGAATTTSGNNTPTLTQPGDEWGAISRIDLIANGGQTLYSFTGRELFQLNLRWMSQRPFITAALGDSATANPAFNSVLMLPIMSPKCTSPLDTCLRTQNLSQLELDITWGNYTNVNANATGWTANPLLTVTAYQDDTTFVPPYLRLVQRFNAQPSGVATDFRINLTANYQYRRILINTQSGTPFVDDPAVLNNVQLISGSTVFFNLDAAPLQQGFANLIGDMPNDILNFETVVGTPPYLAEQMSDTRNNSDNRRAWYDIDLCSDGVLAEAVNSVGLSDFALHLNITKACNINVLCEQLQLLAPAST